MKNKRKRMYHINPTTLEPSVCRAKIKCRFASSKLPHFETKKEAIEFQEELLKNKNFSNHTKSLEKLSYLPNGELKRTLLQEVPLKGNDLENFKQSIKFAEKIHTGQKRKALIRGRMNTDYIEHPLRCCLRLVRLGITDPNLLKAAILHDSVEDGSENFKKFYPDETDQSRKIQEVRRDIEKKISKDFGKEVAATVLKVTNKYHDKSYFNDFTKDERNQQYRDKVRNEINASTDAFVIKSSDLIDNAGGLHHAVETELPMAKNLARKYQPVIEDFQKALEKHRSKLPEKFYDEMKEKFKRTDVRLQQLLQS